MEGQPNFENSPNPHDLRIQMKDISKPHDTKVTFRFFEVNLDNYRADFIIWYDLDNQQPYNLNLNHKSHPR